MKLGDLAGSEFTLASGDANIEIAGLTADSREVRPGFLFAALPGTSMNGTDFIPQAQEKGAAAVLVQDAAGIPAFPGAVVASPDARRALALMAARFYPRQPATIVGVTGTSGKTSVVSFVRQLWQAAGHKAASLGTIGLHTPDGPRPLKLTTPDPVVLHQALAGLAGEGVTHLALEASSHGLQQRRLDGIAFAAAAFTNLSRDHLDYHRDLDDYLAQKLRLFDTLLEAGRPAVVDTDSEAAGAFLKVAQQRELPIFSVGRSGDTLKLTDAERNGFQQRLSILHEGKTWTVKLPLMGGFQAANALVAAGLCMACGADADDILPNLAHLEGARGRLEHVGSSPAGAPVFVDYSHKPGALATALEALRPYASGRLVVVFGCGGDRDKGKRPEMGAVAAANADLVYVTDDNPRTEDPAVIRREILAAAPEAAEVGDRREAIAQAIDGLEKGDLLLVAGKGHETGQIVGDKILPFSDHEVVADILGQGNGA